MKNRCLKLNHWNVHNSWTSPFMCICCLWKLRKNAIQDCSLEFHVKGSMFAFFERQYLGTECFKFDAKLTIWKRFSSTFKLWANYLGQWSLSKCPWCNFFCRAKQIWARTQPGTQQQCRPMAQPRSVKRTKIRWLQCPQFLEMSSYRERLMFFPRFSQWTANFFSTFQSMPSQFVYKNRRVCHMKMSS